MATSKAFFSRKRRRAMIHCIKKKMWQEPLTRHTLTKQFMLPLYFFLWLSWFGEIAKFVLVFHWKFNFISQLRNLPVQSLMRGEIGFKTKVHGTIWFQNQGTFFSFQQKVRDKVAYCTFCNAQPSAPPTALGLHAVYSWLNCCVSIKIERQRFSIVTKNDSKQYLQYLIEPFL
jgi:hypothetical protein